MINPHGLLGVSSQFLKTVIRYLSSEVITGHVFDLVRFVKYNCGVLRQYAAKIIPAQRQIREEKMMVDDDQIRIRGTTMHRGNKTPFELHAFLSGASLAPGVQLGPQLALIWQKGELRPVPSLRQAFPIANLREPIQFFDALQDRLAFHLVNFMPAKEIR